MGLSVMCFGVCFLAACSRLTSPPGPEPIASDTPVTAATAPATAANAHPSASGRRLPPQMPQQPPGPEEQVKIDDVVVGKGAAVKPNDIVSVHYTGTLLDGTKFDSSHDHPGNQPFTTSIPGRVIQGWNKGILGMKVGGHRKLTIPPSLGYGAMPQPKIPANSTLVFDVELVEIKTNPHPQPPPMGP